MMTKLPLMAAMLVLGATTVNAQLNVGSTSAPNADAMLQISGTTKGLLLPSVALSSTTSASPLSAHVAGMVVYNTFTSASGFGFNATGVSPGYYYNNGTLWQRMITTFEQDLHLVAGGHLTADAGVGGNGTSLGTGTNNIAIGGSTIANNTTGSSNVAVGSSAMNANTSGTQSVAIGRNALLLNSSGVSNVAVGYSALAGNTTGSQNTVMGYQAQLSGIVFNSTAIGFEALTSNSGNSNTAVGALALQFNNTGSFNTATGDSALNANTTGSNNVGVGYQALTANTTGSNNTALGYQAGGGNLTGSGNVLLGYNVNLGNPLGDNNIYIGNGVTSFTLRNPNNEMSIGNLIYGSNGNIGIGKTNPKSKFAVAGLPTSSAGLTSGDFWNNGGVVNVIP